MGQGRKALPLEEHLRRGTYNATRHGHSIQPPRAIPAMPEDFSMAERAEWHRLAKLYEDRLTLQDGDSLARLARSNVRLQMLWERVEIADGDVDYSPAQKALRSDWREEWERSRALSAEFGWSPSTRMKIPKAADKATNTWDEITDLPN